MKVLFSSFQLKTCLLGFHQQTYSYITPWKPKVPHAVNQHKSAASKTSVEWLNTQVVSPKTTLHSLTHDQNASNHHSGQHYKLYNWKIVTQLLFTPHGDAKILSSSTLVTRRKTSFSICLPCSKTNYLSYSIKKHDIINMADPSSMQECVSYMNLVMSLVHHRVSVAQW